MTKAAKVAEKISDADVMCHLAHLMFLRTMFKELEIQTIIDVGAHMGGFARMMRDIGFRGQIISIEADPETFPRLQKTMRGDVDWRGLNVAVGADHDGEPRTFYRTLNGHYSSFLPPIEDRGGAASVIKRVEMPVHRLDKLIGTSDLRSLRGFGNVFMKIDVNGMEFDVLAGLGEHIDAVVAIQVRLYVRHGYIDMTMMSDVVRYLEERGFAPAVFAPADERDDNLGLRSLDLLFARA